MQVVLVLCPPHETNCQQTLEVPYLHDTSPSDPAPAHRFTDSSTYGRTSFPEVTRSFHVSIKNSVTVTAALSARRAWRS